MQSIYPEEFSIISADIPYRYKVDIFPNPGGDDNHGKFFMRKPMDFVLLSFTCNSISYSVSGFDIRNPLGISE